MSRNLITENREIGKVANPLPIMVIEKPSGKANEQDKARH